MTKRAHQGIVDQPRHAEAAKAVSAQVTALAAGAQDAGAIGNLALARILSTAVTAAPPDRPAAVPAGLATTQRIEVYAAAVRQVAELPAVRNLPVSMLARYAIYVTNSQLLSIGVPAVKGHTGEIESGAQFASSDWSMTVDTSRFAPDGVVDATIGEMPSARLAELAGSVYHEARHAEQAFRQARLLAGQHHEELNPPTGEVNPADSLAEIIMRVKLASMKRDVELLRLAIDLSIPLSVMRRAAEQPLMPAGTDPVGRVLGAAAHGLRSLTIADVIRPATAFDRAVAAGERGLATHDLAIGEAEAWYEQRHLEDLVYDRSHQIHCTLSILASEAEKAGTPEGIDVAALQAARQPMREIVAAIDREFGRLKTKPDRTVMHRLLEELKEHIVEIGKSVVRLRDLEQEPAAPDRQAQIDLLSEMVVDVVALVDLKLRGPMYEELLMEKDSYEQAARVSSAWEGGSP